MATESPAPTHTPTSKYRPSSAISAETSKARNKARWEREKAAKSFNPLNSQGLSPKELEQETRKLVKLAAYTEAGEYASACLAKAKRSKDDALRMAILFDKAYPKEQPDGLTIHVPAKLLANLSVALGINITSSNQPVPQPVVSQPTSIEIPVTPSSQTVEKPGNAQ